MTCAQDPHTLLPDLSLRLLLMYYSLHRHFAVFLFILCEIKKGVKGRIKKSPPKGSLYLKCNLPVCSFILVITHPCRIQHSLGCQHRRGICILITVIHQSLDSRLDNGLRAFIAWKKGHVHFCPFQAAAPVIKDGI